MTPLMPEMRSDKIRQIWPTRHGQDVFLVMNKHFGILDTQCVAVSFLTLNQSVEDRLGVRLERP